MSKSMERVGTNSQRRRVVLVAVLLGTAIALAVVLQWRTSANAGNVVDWSFPLSKTHPPHCTAMVTDAVPYVQPASNATRIPKTFMQTWKTADSVPPFVKKAWTDLNPTYEYALLDDEACVSFLQQHYGQTYVNYFKGMRYGRYKADFFRYCYLYIMGGVYGDVDMKPILPIDSFLKPETTFFTIWTRGEDHHGHHMFQSYLACNPGNRIMWNAIQTMIAVGPAVGDIPPNTFPFVNHPTSCMHALVNAAILSREIGEGAHGSEYGTVQLAIEEDGKLSYGSEIIANSRYAEWSRNGNGFGK